MSARVDSPFKFLCPYLTYQSYLHMHDRLFSVINLVLTNQIIHNLKDSSDLQSTHKFSLIHKGLFHWSNFWCSQTWPTKTTSIFGPFQRHVCDQKSGKFHVWMATAPGTNMLSTNFWLIIVHPVRVKTYRSLKIKFFVKVKNKVHVTIGHVCDFAWNYGPAQNDFKVKILWCVMEFCIEQYTDDGQHIYKQFHILRRKFYRQDFFWCNILFGHVCDILV